VCKQSTDDKSIVVLTPYRLVSVVRLVSVEMSESCGLFAKLRLASFFMLPSGERSEIRLFAKLSVFKFGTLFWSHFRFVWLVDSKLSVTIAFEGFAIV